MARQRRAGRPNDYDWELSRGISENLAVTQIVQFEAFFAGTAETLVRVRGEVAAGLDSVGSAAGDGMQFAWGLIRGASGSSDVGVSPITEGGANWLAYGICTLFTNVAVGTVGGSVQEAKRFEVDSKAMRKMRENESLYLVWETVNITGAPAINAYFTLRALTAR